MSDDVAAAQRVLLAELDRLRQVEAAARTLYEEWAPVQVVAGGVWAALRDALAASAGEVSR